MTVCRRRQPSHSHRSGSRISPSGFRPAGHAACAGRAGTDELPGFERSVPSWVLRSLPGRPACLDSRSSRGVGFSGDLETAVHRPPGASGRRARVTIKRIVLHRPDSRNGPGRRGHDGSIRFPRITRGDRREGPSAPTAACPGRGCERLPGPAGRALDAPEPIPGRPRARLLRPQGPRGVSGSSPILLFGKRPGFGLSVDTRRSRRDTVADRRDGARRGVDRDHRRRTWRVRAGGSGRRPAGDACRTCQLAITITWSSAARSRDSSFSGLRVTPKARSRSIRYRHCR